VPAVLQFALTVAVGVASGVLSGMFGIGGAVVTTPAIRVLGATTFEAIGSTLPRSCRRRSRFRYNREHLIRAGSCSSPRCSVSRVGVGSRLSAVPGDGDWLMATALLVASPYRTAFPMSAPTDDRGARHLRDEWWMLGIIGSRRRPLQAARHRWRHPHGARLLGGRDAAQGDDRDVVGLRRDLRGAGTITHAFQGDIDRTRPARDRYSPQIGARSRSRPTTGRCGTVGGPRGDRRDLGREINAVGARRA
jgi:hypothetical protein